MSCRPWIDSRYTGCICLNSVYVQQTYTWWSRYWWPEDRRLTMDEKTPHQSIEYRHEQSCPTRRLHSQHLNTKSHVQDSCWKISLDGSRMNIGTWYLLRYFVTNEMLLLHLQFQSAFVFCCCCRLLPAQGCIKVYIEWTSQLNQSASQNRTSTPVWNCCSQGVISIDGDPEWLWIWWDGGLDGNRTDWELSTFSWRVNPDTYVQKGRRGSWREY